MTAILVLILRVLLVIGLYTFLAWALYTIWRDLTLQSQVLASRRVPTLALKIEEGEPEQTLRFEKNEVSIGREPTCDVPISNDTVSANHARLVYHHNQWWIEDLHSTNGTFLNDERVYVQTVLISGDELRVGKVILLVTFG